MKLVTLCTDIQRPFDLPCLERYVQAPMTTKADELSQWSDAVLENADSIPDNADSATMILQSGVKVTLHFDRAKYSSPREEATAAADMARKLYWQQSRVDSLRHLNDGVEASLYGWRKRVRIAAARGEAAAMEVLRSKLLKRSKKLGLRRAVLASFDDDEEDEALGI